MTRRTRSTMCAMLLLAAASAANATDWPQFGFDAAHSGNNTSETTLNRSNVNQLVRRYQVTLPLVSHSPADWVDSAPVYLANVATTGGTRNLLFALSVYGKLLAVDASTGSVVWSHTTTGAPLSASSPAIDPDRLHVYSHGLDGKIHKYQVGDGTEITSNGWPQVSTLKPMLENANGGLAIATSAGTSYLYAVVSGFFDTGDYQGHLTTVNLATNQQAVYNVMCSNLSMHLGSDGCPARGSGVWGRGAVAFDARNQRIYLTSGNGTFNASTGGTSWGDSVLQIGVDGRGDAAHANDPFDSYTPGNFLVLDNEDEDLGSMTMALVPAPSGSSITHLGMQSGKDEALRLINLDNMSGAGGPRNVGGEIQLIERSDEYAGAAEQPAVWVDSGGDGAPWIFFASHKNGLSGYKVGLATDSTPHMSHVWTEGGGAIQTTSPIVANGVLYHVGLCSDNSSNCVIARNPITAAVLWQSAPLLRTHWQSPIVVDGALYVTDGLGKLWAYSLTGTPVNHTVTPAAGTGGGIAPTTPQTVIDGGTTSFSVTANAGYSIGGVTGCGGRLAASVYTTGPITADCTVTATFVATTHVVTPVATASGAITPATPQTVADGARVEFSVVADIGSEIVSVDGCAGVLVGEVYTTGPIVADCTVSATFAGDDSVFANGFDPAS